MKSKNISENLHKGHRERVKNQFFNHGIEDWPEYRVLELLLFFSIPQKDTNELAHTLINHFGSMKNLFESNSDSIKEFTGVTNNTVCLLTLIPQLIRYLSIQENKPKKIDCQDIPGIANYMIAKFYNVPIETLYILYFNSKNDFIAEDIMLEGLFDVLFVNYRKVVEKVILRRAASIILCHNHPSGVIAPSAEDILATKKITRVLSEFNVKILDHIIVSDSEYCSMKSMKYM